MGFAFAPLAALLLSAGQPAPIPSPATSAPQAAAGAPTSTAVTLVPVETRMSVNVTIDGAGPFRFIVDSGASRTVISEGLARLLRLPSVGPLTIHSVGGASVVQGVRIDRLTLGGVPNGPLITPVLREADLGAAGILGIDALGDKRVILDFAANRMLIEPARTVKPHRDPDEIVVTARRRFGELVLVNADANGQPIFAIVDTGSAVTIGNTALYARLLKRGLTPQPVLIHDVTGREVPAIYAAAGDIRIASIKVRNIVAAFADADAFDRFQLRNKPAMLLGMDLLRGFKRVSIDFANKRVTMLPQGTEAALWGFSISK